MFSLTTVAKYSRTASLDSGDALTRVLNIEKSEDLAKLASEYTVHQFMYLQALHSAPQACIR